MPRRTARSAKPTYRCEELTPAHWDDLAALFGENGACGGCWCMWWRVPQGGKLWDETVGDKARRAFQRLVKSGKAHGVLAYEGEAPVGWCAFGPRADFPRTERTAAYAHPGAGDPGLWSVNCFFIARGHRGKGVATALLEAAVEACARHGARVVEAYPIPDGKPLPAAFAWRGPLRMFTSNGFEVTQQLRPARPLVHRQVRGGKRPE